MDLAAFVEQLQSSVLLATLVVVALAAIAFALARYVFARWFVRLSTRSETRVDDLLVRYLRPERMAWLAPLLVVYLCARLFVAHSQSAASLAASP